MKVLITGGSGFVGSHLTDELLKKHHDVTILVRNMDKKNNIKHNLKKIDLKKIDVTNYSKLSDIIVKTKPDAVFHLAGETSHAKSFENPMYDVDINTKSTISILETLRKHNKDCKFILGSTFIVIGKPKKLPVNEESPCQPTTIYGTNRLASEHYCKIYNEVYGLDTTVFRITNSYGPREQTTPKKNAVNFLIHQAFQGKEVTIYDKGYFFRDIIYIKDVVSGILAIFKNGRPGNTYWISSAKKTWFYTFGKILEELTSTKIKYVESPSYTKKVDVGNFVVDNTKLRTLGWSPTYNLKNGIKETLEYFESVK